MITSFVAEFVHTEKGFTCSESGFKDLYTAQECSDAVNYAKSFNSEALYEFDVHFGHIPKGCYTFDWRSFFFNTHPTGEGSSSTTSICRKGN